MNLSRYFLGCFLSICSGFAANLSGIVADPDGRAIPGALIELLPKPIGNRISTITDARGSYSFERLADGDYLIQVSAAGFGSATQHLRLKDGAMQDFALDVAGVRSQVVVTAMDAPQRLDEVARAVDVVTSEQAQLRGKSSLTEALQNLPGLRVQSLGGPGSFTRVLSRGLRAQDTAVTVDGLRFRDAATTQGDASTFLENLFLVDAARVEVLRGTGSAIYGSHAIGGVVNVVTDPGGGPLHGELQSEGGGLGLARFGARLAGGSRIRWSGGVQHVNVVKGNDGNDPFRNTSVQGSAQTDLAPATTISARIWAGDGFSLLNDTPYTAPAGVLPPAGSIRAIPVTWDVQRQIEAGLRPDLGGANLIPNLDDPDSRRASRFYTAAGAISHKFNAAAGLRASYQRMESRRIFEDGPAGVRFEPGFRTVSRIEGSIDTLQVRADLASRRFGLTSGGYEWERETYFSPYEDFNPDVARRENYTASARQRSNSIFGAHQLRLLGDRLQLSFSGRMQNFRLSRPEFVGATPLYAGIHLENPPTAKTGDVALVYFAAGTGTKFRAHAGNGYRAPSIYERFGATFFEGSFGGLGDPRLRPDRSTAFDWGMDQYLFGQKVRVSATHFYTDLREVIAFDSSGFITPATDPFGRNGGYRNTSGGIARGVEIGAEVAIVRGSSVQTSYTYTNSKQRVSTARDNDFFRAPFVSNHQGTVTWLQRFGRNWDAAFDLWIASDHPQIYSRRAFLFPGPRRADAALHYTIPLSDAWKARAFIKFNNVFDSDYLENGFRTPGRWGTGGVSFRF